MARQWLCTANNDAVFLPMRNDPNRGLPGTPLILNNKYIHDAFKTSLYCSCSLFHQTATSRFGRRRGTTGGIATLRGTALKLTNSSASNTVRYLDH